MRIFYVIIFFLFISTIPAFSDTGILLSLKNDIIKMMDDNFDNSSMILILENMARKNILTKIIHEDKIQVIPQKSETIFVKLSGQINDYGKSGHALITITKPDNSQTTIQTPILETGKYVTYLPIDNTFRPGIYLLQTKFQNHISNSYFYLVHKKIDSYSPSWVKTIFHWWAEDQISDKEFVNSLQFLIDSKIVKIILFDKSSSNFEVTIKGDQMVRRGTTHTIVTHASSNDIPVEGAKVTLRIEDYGEDLIREQEGFTNQNGDFIFSWEIPKSFNDIETLLAYISVSNGESSTTQLFKFQVYCLPGESNCKVDGN